VNLSEGRQGTLGSEALFNCKWRYFGKVGRPAGPGSADPKSNNSCSTDLNPE
jgi:hypothetical protein